MQLHHILDGAAASRPDQVAVIHPGRAELSYGQLDRQSRDFAALLGSMGVTAGDRVGLCLHKSVDTVAAIFGILRAGAAYVPVDADSPTERAAYVLADCSVRVVLCEAALAEPLAAELAKLNAGPQVLALESPQSASRMQGLLDRHPGTTAGAANVQTTPDDLAYILYTSGSTGRPKGVMLNHRAAVSFVDWCSATFAPSPDDRFSSHAPFHFDLSIFDIYVPLKHGATLVLVDEATGKDPLTLAGLIADQRISVWYSTPSVLNLLAQYGKLNRHDFSALKHVLFAGEVFPIPQLRALQAHWQHPRYFNLYGPTETNVCTWYALPPEIPADRADPFPIGTTCDHLRSRVVEGAEDVRPGDEGELVIAGPAVMSGYWNLPAQNDRAFLVDSDGTRWYRTGDVVVEDPSGDYVFHGRRDRMVKRHGYRIELGEIESGLVRHPSVQEVAVVALADGTDGGVRIHAYLTVRQPQPGIIEMKRYCAGALPRYMIPDTFTFVDALPHTSTDKIDYRGLAELASDSIVRGRAGQES